MYNLLLNKLVNSICMLWYSHEQTRQSRTHRQSSTWTMICRLHFCTKQPIKYNKCNTLQQTKQSHLPLRPRFRFVFCHLPQSRVLLWPSPLAAVKYKRAALRVLKVPKASIKKKQFVPSVLYQAAHVTNRLDSDSDSDSINNSTITERPFVGLFVWHCKQA